VARKLTVASSLVLAALAALVLGASLDAAPARPVRPTARGWNVLADPIDASQLTDLQFCDRSYWLQPWRAYLDTPPASVLTSGLGINFNVAPTGAPIVARLLGASGFRHARIEEGWGDVSYADPAALAAPAGFIYELRILRANGLRPLILLNANQGAPGPLLPVTLTVAQPAAAGARTVRLTRASVASVVPGLTGFSDLEGYPTAAQDIITSVGAAGTATLSEPLPVALNAGGHAGATLRYQPFAAPRDLNGSPNQAFQTTLSGWLGYVAAVTRAARQALGGDNFDVEVWNELSFGSNFLDAGNYYAPVPAALRGTGDTDTAILNATLAWLRSPAHGMQGVGVTDGFASQTPFATGAGSVGLTALSKHPYTGARTVFGLPGSAVRACRPLNALGQPDGTDVPARNEWKDDFTPSFTDYFPEYYLTAIQTETLIRDIAPITTMVAGTPHGRAVEPPIWVTEQNVDSTQAGLAGAAAAHLHAKATLRTLVSFLNKGVSQLDFYAVQGSGLGLVDLAQLARSRGASGGSTIDALGRLARFVGATDIGRRRSLTLSAVAQQGDDAQFQGDGTAAHPTLHNRDVLGVFPFQVNDHAFVIAAYVITRNIAEVYDTSAPRGDVTRYDLPPENYRLTLGGLNGNTATAVAYDPLSGQAVALTIVARTGRSVTVQLPLTDSPRMVRVEDGG